MEWNQRTLRLLSQHFDDLHSPEPEVRQRGEKALDADADTPMYDIVLLRFVAEVSVKEEIRGCAAAYLEKRLKSGRVPSSDDEKREIKSLIVHVTLSATQKIQDLLKESLVVIGKHEFPMLWRELLPQFRSSLDRAINRGDIESVHGILAVVGYLYEQFGEHLKSPDLKDCMNDLSQLLLKTSESLLVKLNAVTAVLDGILCPLIESLRICFRILCLLNSYTVPVVFSELKGDNWCTLFAACWMFAPDVVWSSVNSYLKKMGQVYHKYLREFVEAVLSFLVADESASCEGLTVIAIKFLVTVSTTGYHEFVAGDKILQKIVERVVIPNVMLRGEDVELFKKNHVEFIRRDMEGSDQPDTRRSIACELLKGIAGNYKEKITKRVSTQINNCLTLFAENPSANWKHKDCAIYLAVSLSTKEAGGASVSTDHLDNVTTFFKTHIVPELEGQEDVDASPLLKAGALKFLTKFGVLIPKSVVMAHLRDVVRCLGSSVNVVRSYAATCIEKLLIVKENNGVARYTATDFDTILLDLMTSMFGAFEKPNSEANEHVMRCLTRVFQMADPSNPKFNKRLFQTIALHIAGACEINQSLIPEFEKCLMPSLQRMIGKDLPDIAPYAFQLLAKMVELRRCPNLPPLYLGITDLLLLPYLWRKSTYIPSLVCVFQSFMQQAPDLLTKGTRLRRVFDLAKQLVTSREEYWGFRILNPVIENVGYSVMGKHMKEFCPSLIARLQEIKTPRIGRCAIISMSLFVVKHGTRNLVDLVNNSDFDLIDSKFHGFLAEFWIPNLKSITGHMEVKLTVVASTKLICESASLVDPASEELWGKSLDGIVTLLCSLPPEGESAEDKPEYADPEEATVYQISTESVRLHYAGKKETLQQYGNPIQFSVVSLAGLFSRFRGRFPPIIKKYLSADDQAALEKLCTSYDCAIV